MLMSGGGVYVYRARKPAARFRIPFLSWHFAYVGETTSFYHRHAQHMEQRDWSDRSPYVWCRIPLPRWKWLLHLVETLVILTVWPVYNHKKNLWNPRRITLTDQRRQRSARDAAGWCFNWSWGHSAAALALTVALWMVTR
jgi:hypothetical protein